MSYLVLVFDVNVEKIAAGQCPRQLTSIRCWNLSWSWQHQLRLVNRPEIDMHCVHHNFIVQFLLSYINKLENVATANALQLKAARRHASPFRCNYEVAQPTYLLPYHSVLTVDALRCGLITCIVAQ